MGMGSLALAAVIGSASLVVAQSRIAPHGAVESAPLAPLPGTASPIPAQAPAPPAPVPDAVPGPQPVQPAPPAPPVEPQPVQPPPSLPVPAEPQPVQPPPALPTPGQAPSPGPQSATPAPPAEPRPVQPPPSLPGPAEPKPVQPPPMAPAPGQPLPPVAPPQQTQAPGPDSTLAGRRGDPTDVDEVVLVPRTVLTLSGQASWDQGQERLSQSLDRLREQAARLNLPLAGRPLALFTETDDNGFRFEAMQPVAPPQGAPPALPEGMRIGSSPAGRSLRFTHVAPYDEIETTYETITAYLEAKGITVKDAFLEEYVGNLKDPADPNLEINVYVQPR